VKYYAVAEIDVTDASWVADYIDTVTALVEARGGRYLARTPRVERLEGRRAVPQVFLIIEWPNREAAYAFYESEDYAPFRRRREQGARNEFVLVAGEDVGRMDRSAPRNAP
jgi:uncharacterized protein (DUF1330 family)